MRILSLEEAKNFKFAEEPKIVRFRWRAYIDTKTCPLCSELHGQIFDSKSHEYGLYQPPAHPRCRCRYETVTSDETVIPEVDFKKPSEDLIERYGPFFMSIPFLKGKDEKEILEILPFISEPPVFVFNPTDIFSIEDYIAEMEFLYIQEAEDKMKEREKEVSWKRIWVIFFLDKFSRVILEKEVEEDQEIDFSKREENLIIEKASSFLISPGNDLVERQLFNLFNLKKR